MNGGIREKGAYWLGGIASSAQSEAVSICIHFVLTFLECHCPFILTQRYRGGYSRQQQVTEWSGAFWRHMDP